MKRNNYTKEFENYCIEHSKHLTKEELRQELENKFNLTVKKISLENYLYRHRIKCVDYNVNKARNVKKAPIGYEHIKSDGTIRVKIANPDIWEFKQRLVYKKYHKCELTENDCIVFLDGNRQNFDIDNLYKVSKEESARLVNCDLLSNNKELSKLGINVAKLMVKIKEKGDKNEKNINFNSDGCIDNRL